MYLFLLQLHLELLAFLLNSHSQIDDKLCSAQESGLLFHSLAAKQELYLL